jgi:hypothetical protein
MKPSAHFEALFALSSQLVPLRIWGECGVKQNRDRPEEEIPSGQGYATESGSVELSG